MVNLSEQAKTALKDLIFFHKITDGKGERQHYPRVSSVAIGAYDELAEADLCDITYEATPEEYFAKARKTGWIVNILFYKFAYWLMEKPLIIRYYRVNLAGMKYSCGDKTFWDGDQNSLDGMICDYAEKIVYEKSREENRKNKRDSKVDIRSIASDLTDAILYAQEKRKNDDGLVNLNGINYKVEDAEN